MNPQRLLQHFDRIAEVPDAVARLRRFILDLAVRGKLVEQDADDEPASELLKRIQAEKVRLLKLGQFREPRSAVRIERGRLPFASPAHWVWTRLVDIADPSYGFAFPSAQFNSTKRGMPLIRIRDISNSDTEAYFEGNFDPTYVVTAGDYLVGMDGDFNLRRWTGKDGLLNQRVMRIKGWRCNVDPEFVRLPLQMVLDHMHDETSLTTVKHLSAKQVNGIEVPLPPLAEQRRIVAKVDELMALCDRLGVTQKKREQRRDQLNAASLNRINQPGPSADGEAATAFREHARFHLDHLLRLTTRPEHIKSLRQTILNLAVRGRLVPQDPEDEPAAELLKRISVEKTRLAKDGVEKRGAPLPPLDLEEAPFDLPKGWHWARFPELGTFGRGKSKHRPRNDTALYEGGTHLFIQTGDVARSQGFITTYTSKYNDYGLAQSMKWPAGTLCITIAANIADSGILSFEACFPDSVVGFVPASMFQNARYFEYFVRTAKENLLEFAPATAQKNINLAILNAVLVPLPPLAEQHRIVAKVDELMAICDQLEAQLTTTQTDSRRLLEAVLHEALAPATERAIMA